MTLRQRLRSLLWRVPVEQEVREELAHHVELRTRELRTTASTATRRGPRPSGASATSVAWQTS